MNLLSAKAGTNWAGTHTFHPNQYLKANSIAEVAEALRGTSGPARAVGTRHSFHDLADTDGLLIDMAHLPNEPRLHDDHTASFPAGMTYAVACRWLDDRGRGLANLGSLPHISIGGATATGTHGSGARLQTLSASVVELQYLDADGEPQSIGRDNFILPGAVVHLGSFGIVTSISLATEPNYQVAATVNFAPDAATWVNNGAGSDSYSASLFTCWDPERRNVEWHKQRVTPSANEALELSGATLGILSADPAALARHDGSPRPWWETLPHFRGDKRPSFGHEIQSEYYVGRDVAEDALRAVQAASSAFRSELIVSEIRTVRADDLWLSGAYLRDTIAIHFTWHRRPRMIRRILPHLERTLAPFGARPHWGKWHAFNPHRLREVFPAFDAARDLFESLDPTGRFSNVHLERIGLRKRRLSIGQRS